MLEEENEQYIEEFKDWIKENEAYFMEAEIANWSGSVV